MCEGRANHRGGAVADKRRRKHLDVLRAGGLGSGDQDEPEMSSLVVGAKAHWMGSQRAVMGPLKRQKSNTAFAHPELRGLKKEIWLGSEGWTGHIPR